LNDRLVVVGAGSWGTALADLLAKKGNDVTIWALEDEVVQGINYRHENPLYLAGVELSPRLTATSNMTEAVRDARMVVSVSPAQHVRKVMAEAGRAVTPGTLIVSASKGIEKGTLATMAQVLQAILPGGFADRLAFLSGPSFAAEVARELATAVTVASENRDVAAEAQAMFQTPYFRVYTSSDVMGVELGGALKNVIAIATGMGVGLGLGHNATAALITRGLAEMARLGMALGASPITFSGLAGMGDLILTCTGELSRNRHVGVELGRGRKLPEILAGMTSVAEGVDTTIAAKALAAREGIEMPIVDAVHSVLFDGTTALEALETLMMRQPKPEFWS
jgi:glycerol-3-phosphate dehydrogenase (NAD(P)+)